MRCCKECVGALREEEYVDVSKLFQYAADQVPQLARHIGGIQKPLIMAPRGTSFDLGRLQLDDRKIIPLALVKPLLLRPRLLDANELDDTLGLEPLLRKRLNDETFVTVRGKEGKLRAVFVDADELPGAIKPSGTYTVKGNKVMVKLVLRQDGKTVANLEVEGARDDAPALVTRIVEAISENLKKLKT